MSSEIIVELTLNNKLRKLPIEEDEVKFSRIWTSDGKDEFRLNNKLLIKSEVNNILESCGLSRVNPYNIVPQGKVNKLSMMNEEELYELLQEITGIKQFQMKKIESFKYLEEAGKDKLKIREILEEINIKIEDLQTEKDAFENFEKKENTAKW